MTALRLASLSVLAFLPWTPLTAQPGGDLLTVHFLDAEQQPLLRTTALPRGPAGDDSAFVLQGEEAFALAHLPDGRLVAALHFVPLVTAPPATSLAEVRPDGSLVYLGNVALEAREVPSDLAATPDGRLYLLTHWTIHWNPPEAAARLLELDPDSGAILAASVLPESTGLGGFPVMVGALAPAPRGLYALSGVAVHLLDPNTAAFFGEPVAYPQGLVEIFSADADSSGALWALAASNVSDPPVPTLARIDPGTGATELDVLPVPGGSEALAVDRRCAGGPLARCLQGGRFRVTAEWRTDNDSGPALVAPSGSTDSALLWFFSPANWEILVKVLDACELNDHFWVFSAATTDVEYTLRVTDLQTGVVYEDFHPAGTPAPALTDTSAFATCP